MRRLVLLSSGWGKVDIAWSFISKSLRESGFDVISCSYPYRGIVSIEESAEYTKHALHALDKEYDHITFMGHSMGGIIGRYIIQKTSHGELIDSYISLASPHQGSHLSSLVPWSQSAQQMRVGSEFLEDLNMSAWPDIPALSFSGGWDFVVSKSQAQFHGTQDHVHLERTTHVGLLFNTRAFLELWAWLTYNVFEEVGFNEPTGYESRLYYA